MTPFLDCVLTMEDLFDVFLYLVYKYFIEKSCILSSFNEWWSDRMQDVVSIFIYLLRLAFCASICSNLKNVHELQGRYILLSLGELFCNYIRSIWFIIKLQHFYLVFSGWYILRVGYLSEHLTMWELICELSCSGVYEVDTLVLGEQMFKFPISSWWIFAWMIM